MESILTEAESYVQHLSMAIFLCKILVIIVKSAHSQIATKRNKPQSSNTADMQQSTNVHDAHHGIQLLPQKQHRRASAPNDNLPPKRKHTQTNGEWSGVRRGRTENIGKSYNFFFFKKAYFHLTGPDHTEHPVCRCGDFGFVSRHRPAEHRILDVSAAPTLRRLLPRLVAAGVSSVGRGRDPDCAHLGMAPVRELPGSGKIHAERPSNGRS